MNLEKAVRNINRSIVKSQPKTVNQQWIKYRCGISYLFIVKNIKTEFNRPDWDLVISRLEKRHQKLWLNGIKRKEVSLYKNESELNIILNKYNNKLYTFLARKDEDDKNICDWISIKLVRMAQGGNILAKEKLVNLLSYLINQWIEYDESLFRWKGYNELIIENIGVCIRRFRYAGTFLGYLYKTLEYSGRGLVPLEKFFLDNVSLITGKRISEIFIKN